MRLDRQVWLDRCRCEKPIDFQHLQLSGALSLEGSFVSRSTDGSPSVNLRSALIEGELRLLGVTIEGDVQLAFAKVGGPLGMNGSTFEQGVLAAG